MDYTLSQLRTMCRQKADMETSQFVSDSELTGLINLSLTELYDLWVRAYGEDYFIADPFSISVVPGTADYSLPSTFYKMRGVDARIGSSGQWYSLKPFNFNERNRNQDIAVDLMAGPNLRYKLFGNKIRFSPTPNSNTNVQVWFIPQFAFLVNDSDVFTDINGSIEYVILDVAIKMLLKEESDPSALMNQKLAIQQRLQNMAANRDLGQSLSVSDIYSENSSIWRR